MAPPKKQSPKPPPKKAKADKSPPKKGKSPKKSNRPSTYRQYSEGEKAAVLAVLDANKGSVKKTAEQTGVPLMTIWEWANGRIKTHPETTKLRFEKGMALADITEEMARLLAETLPDKYEDANLRDAATAYGILVDKMNALRAANANKNPNDPGSDGVELEQTDDHLLIKLRRAVRTARQGDQPQDAGVATQGDSAGGEEAPGVEAVPG